MMAINNVLLTIRSIEDNLDGGAFEFIANLVSGPVYTTTPIHHSVALIKLPLNIKCFSFNCRYHKLYKEFNINE